MQTTQHDVQYGNGDCLLQYHGQGWIKPLHTHLCIQCVTQEILIVQETLGNSHFILRLEMHIQNFITPLSRSDPVAQVPECHVQQLLQVLPTQVVTSNKSLAASINYTSI